MNLAQWLTVVGALLTNAGIMFSMWKYFDDRITRVYERMDEIKEKQENDYVKKEMCSVQHQHTVEDVRGIELRMNARFNALEKKVEESFSMILDMLKAQRQ